MNQRSIRLVVLTRFQADGSGINAGIRQTESKDPVFPPWAYPGTGKDLQAKESKEKKVN